MRHSLSFTAIPTEDSSHESHLETYSITQLAPQSCTIRCVEMARSSGGGRRLPPRQHSNARVVVRSSVRSFVRSFLRCSFLHRFIAVPSRPFLPTDSPGICYESPLLCSQAAAPGQRRPNRTKAHVTLYVVVGGMGVSNLEVKITGIDRHERPDASA